MHWAGSYDLMLVASEIKLLYLRTDYDCSPEGLVVVVDGQTLHMTDLSKAVVPPPLSQY